MDDLTRYVNHLFHKYKGDERAEELKEEVLTNLQARVADLEASGMTHYEAVEKAKDSISSIDHLIDNKRIVDSSKLKLQLFQRGLIYTLIAWIITLPVRVVGVGSLLHNLLMVVWIITGFVYLGLQSKNKQLENTCLSINYQAILKIRNLSWLIWALFIVTTTALTTAIHFGSNIWFSRPVTISGPYQFAVMVLRYTLPFISIVIPLLVSAVPKAILDCEVDNYHE